MPLDAMEPSFDRPFEALFRELRDRIPRYAPQWTDWNDSDPGITLLQLFAWLAELTLHSMSDVPRKHYLKFAELLGLELAPARPAIVQLVFSPKPAEPPRTIPERTRCSAQVDGPPPATLVFETTQTLDVIGAPLDAMFVFGDGTITRIALDGGLAGAPFWPLGRNPMAYDALYLAFKPNPANPTPFPAKMRFLALRPAKDTVGVAQRAGEQDQDLVPPVTLAWEYRPKADQAAWEPLQVFDDGSVAFTRDGYVDVEGPAEIEPAEEPAVAALLGAGEKRYWLRIRLDQNRYPAGRAPYLDQLLPNAVDAVQLASEEETLLGTSSGRADQAFPFPQRPVDPGSLALEIRPANGAAEKDWTPAEDFYAATREDKVYVLDAAAGRVTFGDGTQGRIPPAGAAIVAAKWRHGGGKAGNDVAPGAVRTMVDQVRGIEKVTNPRSPAGGAEEESLDHFMKNAPGELRRNGRAVTEEDFETHARSIGGVLKARAVGGRHPDYPGVVVPGAITVFVVADSDARKPAPSAELIRALCRSFDAIRLLTTELYVAAPRFVEIRVEARLLADPRAAFDQVSADARQRLDAYLSPAARDFGENLSPAAIYGRLFGAPDENTQVRSVEDLLLYVDGVQHDLGRPVEIAPDAIVFPGAHLIVVRPDPDDRSAR
jgi:predicted phage baseplate assembly protein